MRAHGTNARYVLGPAGFDSPNGCRCGECREAHRIYARDLQRNYVRSGLGIEEAWPGRHVPARPARRHLAWLRRQGVGLRAVEKWSGVGRTTLAGITTGETRNITRRTEIRVLAVGTFAAGPHALIDAAKTWARIADLLSAGWSKAAIARRITGPTAVSLQLRKGKVTVRQAAAVEALHREVFPEREGRPIPRRPRSRTRSPEPLPGRTHGLVGTYHDGCGCERCRLAAAAYRARYRKKVEVDS